MDSLCVFLFPSLVQFQIVSVVFCGLFPVIPVCIDVLRFLKPAVSLAVHYMDHSCMNPTSPEHDWALKKERKKGK